MRAPRVFAEGARVGEALELAGVEAHHLVRVLRRRAGDAVQVVGGGGELLAGRIEAVDESPSGPRVSIRVGEPVATTAVELLPWTVAVAPVAEKGFEVAVRLASELGLERLVPLVAERGQILRPGGSAASRGRWERWERIARESAKQCARARPLEVGPPATLDQVARSAGAARLDLWIAHPGGPPPALDALHEEGAPRPALFLIGPEGGFTDREVERAEACGAARLGFPTPVLRTPTAVLLVAALGVLASWSSPRAGPGA